MPDRRALASPQTVSAPMNRSMRLRLVVAFALMLSSAAAFAREVAGMTLPESVAPGAGQPPLPLNGAGIRRKFFIKVYVGALYLPARSTDAASVLRNTGPVAVRMYILYGEISKEKLIDAWDEGFNANLDDAGRTRLHERIERFDALFPTVHRGDVIGLDYTPGTGTTVSINNEKRGVIEGADFMQAWLRIWLGRVPADSDLKRAMLGGD